MKKNLKWIGMILLVVLAVVFVGCKKPHRVALVAHMGYWDCEAGGTYNSIAALAAAQDIALWGSECDVNMTADNVVIVCHGPVFNGVDLRNSNYADTVRFLKLKNGEPVPTLDQYLEQAAKSRTVPVLELKPQLNEERENTMVELTIASLKKHGLYSPKRVAFISFSPFMCKKIAREHPAFTNQYLNGDRTPADLHKDGINGLDYNYKVLHKHPEWVKEAHDLGMSVNVWAIGPKDNEEYLREMIALDVDQVTTSYPILARSVMPKGKELPVGKKK